MILSDEMYYEFLNQFSNGAFLSGMNTCQPLACRKRKYIPDENAPFESKFIPTKVIWQRVEQNKASLNWSFL